MADSIERTIYKLEIDDSAYTKGIDSLSASTGKFAQQQQAANKALEILEATLAEQSQALQKAKKDLEAYTGADEKYKQQLQKSYNQQAENNAKLVGLVAQSRREYEAATKAAQDFANTSARANNLPSQPGARVPTPQIVPPSDAVGISSQIFNTVNLQEFKDLAEITANTSREFDELRDSITLAEERLKQLDEGSEEFKALVPIIEAGKKALEDYDKAAEGAGEATQSLRGQIRAGREELVKMEQAGKANSKEYFELEKRVASLTDAYGDQQQRIKILASDTKALDFGKGAITAATAAFSAYTSVAVLVGDQNEELQKKTLQLFAAMQLLQSLEQLSNLTRREGVLATLAQSGAQAAYTAVVGASTGAMRGFKLALAGTGIGLAIAGITALVIAYRNLQSEIEEAAKDQRTLADINKQAAESVGDEVAKLIIFKDKLNDVNIPLKERVKVAKEYNKTADEANKIDTKQIENLDLINTKIAAQNELILKRAIALAATAKLGQVAGSFVESELELNRVLERTGKQRDIFLEETENFAIKFRKSEGGSTEMIKEMQKFYGAIGTTEILGFFKIVENRKKAQAELDEANRLLAPLISTDALVTDKGGTKDPKAIENVFVQEQAKLLARIAELRRSEADGITKINEEFAAKLIVEQNRISDLLKEKKLTPTQADILVKLAIDANAIERDKALADFNKKVIEAREKLNDELRKLQEDQTEQTLNLIQDEFEKRKALIDFNEQQELAEQKEFTEDRLAVLDLDRLLLGEEAYQRAKDIIITNGEQNSLNILGRFAEQRKDLAADIFKKSLEAISAGLDIGLIFRDENLANEVRDASNRFLEGKIKYEDFQKELTAIQKREEGIRRDAVLSNQRSELAELDRYIASITDKTSTEYKELTKQRNDLRAKIATGEKEDAIKDAEDENTDPNKKKVETLNDYVVAVGDLANSVIQFWQAANEAESAALDRSISLQEKRVTAAQRIAERGNAQYLKAEEDRLKELTIKRENAARRELAINAALQASQLLVGITGAISKIATPGIGLAESIGAFAVIVSSLAAGYGLVKSLQGSQPRLAKGDPYVKRNGHPSGVDTIPAWLNEGEAVIPTDKNKQYHDSVQAIYYGKVPAEDMNNFVKNFHKVKSVPRVNYDRIKESAELSTTHDGRMSVALSEQNKLIMENNELQRMTLRAMKNMAVSATIDRDGVAISVNEYIHQMNINKKT